MSDPTNPAPPAAAAPPSALDALAAQVQPPAAVAAPAQPPAPQPPRVLNPYASKPVAPAPLPVAAAAAPAADPTADLRATFEGLRSVLAATVAQDLAGVPDNVRAAVLSIAGDDPVRQRQTLDAMRANGLGAAPQAPALIPPGATTAPPAQMPAPSAQEQTDAAALATFQKAQATSPMFASVFRTANAAAIDRALARTARN